MKKSFYFCLPTLLFLMFSCSGFQASYRLTNTGWHYNSEILIYCYIDYTIEKLIENPEMSSYDIYFDVYDTEGYCYAASETVFEIVPANKTSRSIMIDPQSWLRNSANIYYSDCFTIEKVVPRYIEVWPDMPLRSYVLEFTETAEDEWIAIRN